MSAIDPNSNGNGAAYPLRLSESVACLMLAADKVEWTDEWEEREESGKLKKKWEIGRCVLNS